MSKRPLIGVPGRRKLGGDVSGLPETFAGVAIDLYLVDYTQATLAAGGLPVYIPIDIDPAEIASRLDGLLLPGGADVEPLLYDAAAETDLYPPEAERDRLEIALLDLAIAEDIPVLGICRGLQVVNVHGGGSLHQHVPEHSYFHEPADFMAHEVAIEPGTRLHDLFGDRTKVNSMHHQTVDRPAADYLVSARAPDGTVEAIEHPDHDVLAVQWHPEMLDSSEHAPLFEWLVRRAAS